MKLKKIASLALAGVMAVSMLAGCNNGSNTEEQPNSTVPTNVVSYANSLLSGKEKAVFEFETDTKVDEALKAVATDASVFSSKDIAGLVNQMQADATTGTNAGLRSELADKLDIDLENGVYFKNGAVDGKDKYNAYVYVLSTKLDENGAVKLVVDSIKANMASDKQYFPVTGGSTTKYSFDYEANISAVKVTAPDNADNSVWVVAVVYTQTATEASNA